MSHGSAQIFISFFLLIRFRPVWERPKRKAGEEKCVGAVSSDRLVRIELAGMFFVRNYAHDQIAGTERLRIVVCFGSTDVVTREFNWPFTHSIAHSYTGCRVSLWLIWCNLVASLGSEARLAGELILWQSIRVRTNEMQKVLSRIITYLQGAAGHLPDAGGSSAQSALNWTLHWIRYSVFSGTHRIFACNSALFPRLSLSCFFAEAAARHPSTTLDVACRFSVNTKPKQPTTVCWCAQCRAYAHLHVISI